MARIYSDLRLHLKKAGTPMPANDLWIASLVLHLDLPLLSCDQHFDHVPGLSRLSFWIHALSLPMLDHCSNFALDLENFFCTFEEGIPKSAFYFWL